MKGIPYLNSGVLSSALSFDKWYCNQFLKSFGIPVAKSLFLRTESDFTPHQIVEELGLPIFIKPSDSGSSYGISKVKIESEIESALNKSFNEGGTTVIESFLDGIEVTCGVYENAFGIQVLPLTEIASENEFFDYDAKYNGKSQEITPARVSDEVRIKVEERAKYIYELLQLRSVARIDFMIVGDEPFVIEVNTTPGFSPASIVPQMLACKGLSITDFWREIVSFELGI
jgi:D-alanine-D-alanine ligase